MNTMDEEDEIVENIIYIDSVSKHVNTAEEKMNWNWRYNKINSSAPLMLLYKT